MIDGVYSGRTATVIHATPKDHYDNVTSCIKYHHRENDTLLPHLNQILIHPVHGKNKRHRIIKMSTFFVYKIEVVVIFY